MKNLMALSLLACSTLAFADVNVDVLVNMDGKEVQKQCVFKQDTQMWCTTEDDIMVQATATAEGENEVVVNVKVFMKNESGESVLVSEPVFKTVWGEVAKLEIKNEAGEGISLSVVATK